MRRDEIPHNLICIISFSEIRRDARVLRQIEFLHGAGFQICVIGFGQPPAWLEGSYESWQCIERRRRRLAQRVFQRSTLYLGRIHSWFYDRRYWNGNIQRQALTAALRGTCDAYHANEFDALPVAAEAARRTGARLVFDAHEYAPGLHEHEKGWTRWNAPVVEHILRKYTPAVDLSFTVAPFVRDRYRSDYGLEPIVVLSAPKRSRVLPHDVDPNRIRLIHHSSADRVRRTEGMIDVIAHADERFSLDLMLMDDDPGYVEELQRYAQERARGRVTLRPTVPANEVVHVLAQYDMGIHILPPASTNNLIALPNKLFDFIQAGLAVCIGPSPSMAEVVNRFGFGVVSESFEPEAVASTLNSLTIEDIHKMREAAEAAASDLNAEREMAKMTAAYSKLLGGVSLNSSVLQFPDAH